MSSRPFTAHVVRFLLPSALFLLGACQTDQAKPPAAPRPSTSEDKRAEISNEFNATAQVTAIAAAERVVTLRREDGALFDVQVGEGARNFDQIAVGDELRVRYKEILVASKLPAGTALRGAQGELAAARTKAGAKPGAGVGMSTSVRVRIESIDRERSIVVFSL